MLSYSTGTSGSGQSVEKVKEATRIAQEKRPDLLIDGPLQYDAAVMKMWLLLKAPNSKVQVKQTYLYSLISTQVTSAIKRYNVLQI